jgi:CheY-like chemotaxis protein
MEADDGPRVRIAVTDDGPGVDPRVRDRLFDPFFTTKAPGEGTGLGLPVSFGIIAAHGGQLAFEPEPHGATFAITLPVVPGRDAAAPVESGWGLDDLGPTPQPPAPAKAVPARGRVLVLDDEPAIRAFLRKAMPAAGFDADVSGDGAEAVDRARQSDYAVVLCDYRMAGMSGTEVYEALVSLRPELADRFVFMSGDVLNPELAAFAATHHVALLAKPFDLDTVHRLVRSIAEKAARRDGDGTQGSPTAEPAPERRTEPAADGGQPRG